MKENTEIKLTTPIYQSTTNRFNTSHGGFNLETKALEKANRINRENRKAGIKVEREYNLMKKSKDNPNSLRAIIDGMCFNCMGGSINEMPDPGWQNSICTCTAPDCTAYHQRPYQPKAMKTERSTEDGDVPQNTKPTQLNLPTAGN